MSIVVENGSGLSNADSYISVADADSYITSHSNSTLWGAATTAVKEKALRLATQYLDTRYNAKWRGVKATASQSLAWPRNCVEDDDGYILAADSLPQKLKDACTEAALRIVEGDNLLAPLENSGEIKSETVRVGPITETIEYAGANSPVTTYPLIDGLIRGLIYGAGILRRG